MEDINVIPEETVEVAVEEVAKHLDGESFIIGAVVGTLGTTLLGFLVKKVFIPVGRKVKIRIKRGKATKEAEYESDGLMNRENE